jgi:flavin reductase (DIM6/NTAB) family NADH-FMN oxidoreductase RutF
MICDYLQFDPAIIEKRQVYRLLTGAVGPRPIGWASTVNKSGITNLAPFSFFTVVCVIPPMISLTIARNPDGPRSTRSGTCASPGNSASTW